MREWSVGVDALTEDGHDDGTFGEWSLRWYVLGGRECVRVEVFGDAWAAMAAIDGYWDAMLQAEQQGGAPDAVLSALVGIGFCDRTERTMPARFTSPPAGSDRTEPDQSAPRPSD